MKIPPPTLKTQLVDCPQWSTMQWISPVAIVRIDSAAEMLGSRRNVSRRDVVGIMIMYLAPEDPAELWKILDPYLRAHKGSKGKGDYQALMTKLPSPVSLRLDALVAQASKQGTVYRQDLIGALAMKTLPSRNRSGRERLLGLYKSYRQATAGDAALRGMRKKDVLETKPPQPGRRRVAPRIA